MKGAAVVTALKKKLKAKNDSALSKALGVTGATIHFWNKAKKITPSRIARLIHKARLTAAESFRKDALRPVVEFFPIEASPSNNVFNVKDGNKDHPYRKGLKAELDETNGVYVFFDSRGQAIYVGKAKKQDLWREMNLAFKRERGALQKIKRVKHPNRHKPYRTSSEKARQIGDYAVPLSDLARYFSAYSVTETMIDDLEAVLVRSFANDLLNKRMERFTAHRNKATKPRKKKV